MAYYPSQRVNRFVSFLVLFLRLGSMGCFIYSGGLAAKTYGPEGLTKLKASILNALEQDANDPLALAMKERDAAKQKLRAGSWKGGAGSDRSATNDDPYKYLTGGKKAEKKKPGEGEENAGKDGEGEAGKEGAAGDQLASAKAGSLWDKGQLGEGGFDGITDFGGGTGGGAAGAGAGPGAAGGALGDALGKAQDLSQAKAGAGKSSALKRSVRAGISKGRFGTKNRGSVKGNARAAAYTSRSGGSGFQKQAGAVGAGFGQGTSANTLNIPGGPGGKLDAGLDGGSVDSPNLENPDVDIPDGSIVALEQPGEAEQKAMAGLLLAATALGIGLAVVKMAGGAKAGPAAIAWWVAYAVGAALIVAALFIAIGLMTSDNPALQGIGQAGLGQIIGAAIAWVGLGFAEGTEAFVMAALGMAASAIGNIISLFSGGQKS